MYTIAIAAQNSYIQNDYINIQSYYITFKVITSALVKHITCTLVPSQIHTYTNLWQGIQYIPVVTLWIAS